MKLLISGLCGHMGPEVAKLALAGCRGTDPAATVGVDVNACGAEGMPCAVSFEAATDPVFTTADCIVDFSHHSATTALLDYAVANKMAVVLATTGHTEEEKAAITEAANKALDGLGTAAVTLCREAFPIREYDSFTLPSGVYESLRVKIGEAQGRNWWCVVFPTLCIPAVGENFDSVAAGAGFSETLTEAITAPETEVSFFFLDLLGKAESFLFSVFH